MGHSEEVKAALIQDASGCHPLSADRFEPSIRLAKISPLTSASDSPLRRMSVPGESTLRATHAVRPLRTPEPTDDRHSRGNSDSLNTCFAPLRREGGV